MINEKVATRSYWSAKHNRYYESSI